jgi:hypothetical protein
VDASWCMRRSKDLRSGALLSLGSQFQPFQSFNLSRIRHRASDGLANAMWRGLISLWLSFCTLLSSRLTPEFKVQVQRKKQLDRNFQVSGIGEMRDRRRYLRWVFEAKKRFGLSVLDYMVTSNHIHPIAPCTPYNLPTRFMCCTLSKRNPSVALPRRKKTSISFAAGLWKRSGLTGKGAIDHGD